MIHEHQQMLKFHYLLGIKHTI